MSSGYYVTIPPKSSYIKKKLEEINEINNELKKAKEIYARVMAEAEEIASIIQSTINSDIKTEYSSTTQSFGTISDLEHTYSVSGISFKDLFFADMETSGEKIVFVSLDFSEVFTIENAKQSMEYKKLAFASSVTKSVMLLSLPDEQARKRVTDLLKTMYSMLDDNTVELDYFTEFIIQRLNDLEKSYGKDSSIPKEKWNRYCALCAMTNSLPGKVKADEIDSAVEALEEKAYNQQYVADARTALAETFKELGLEVTDTYELDSINGYIIEDSSTPDYKLFLSDTDNGFALEMIDASGHKGNEMQKKALCAKRHLVTEKMKEKGFSVAIEDESDDAAISSGVLTTTRRRRADSAELVRKRYAKNRNNVRAKAIGVQ